MIETNKLKCYKKKEVKELIKNNTEFIYVDDGMTEILIRFEDVEDFIVMVNREHMKYGFTNLKFLEMYNLEPIITTRGEFLDRCDLKIRERIIDRLVKLQLGDIKYKKVKVIDEYTFDKCIDEEEDNNKYLIEVTKKDKSSKIIKSDIDYLEDAINQAKEVMKDNIYSFVKVKNNDRDKTYLSITDKEERYFYNAEGLTKNIEKIINEYCEEEWIIYFESYTSDEKSQETGKISISDIYKELLEQLNIEYSNIKTVETKPCYFETTIFLNKNKKIKVYLKTWDKPYVLKENIIKIKNKCK